MRRISHQGILTRRSFIHQSAIFGSAALVGVSPFCGCGRQAVSRVQSAKGNKSTSNTIPAQDSDQQQEGSKPKTQADRHVSRHDDPKVKAAHDAAGTLVRRLRKIGPPAQHFQQSDTARKGDGASQGREMKLDAERERHLFNMIRVSEYAWAGLLDDLNAANAGIDRAEEFCKKHGV